MLVTRTNVASLIASGLLPEGDLIVHVVSGPTALPLPPLFNSSVRWRAETASDNAVVTQQSDNYPPFTFYEWNELEVDAYEDEIILRFTMRTIDQSIPIEALVMRERARAV